jgi:hypothetical protein
MRGGGSATREKLNNVLSWQRRRELDSHTCISIAGRYHGQPFSDSVCADFRAAARGQRQEGKKALIRIRSGPRLVLCCSELMQGEAN